MKHHEDTLAAYAAEVRGDDDALALVVTGSVALGTERPDSDVDVYLVVTDEAFDRAASEQALSFVRHDVASYDGGYVDVKLASPSYLTAAVERANDPARASFVGARVHWSEFAGLEALLDSITTIAEAEWARRKDSFAAQMRLYAGYFLPQGAQLDDPFLLRWSALHFVTAASRALLAHNRVIFKGPKYLRSTVRGLADLPDGLTDMFDELLEHPAPELGMQALAAVEQTIASPLPPDQTLSRFVADNELAWLWRVLPPEEY